MISRAEARAQGLTRYCTGKPCTHGHISERLVCNGECIGCNRARAHTKEGRHSGKRRASKWQTSEKGLASRQKWHAANSDLINRRKRKQYESNPEPSRARSRNWQHINPDAAKAKKHARRARKNGAEGSYTRFDLHSILELQGLSCAAAHCGVSFLVADPTIDHIVPLSRGGSNWPDNIQLLCLPCNDSKGVKTMEEWVQ
jgi:5-methylcytosine-specific restriction endonuclease McrA